MMNENERPNQEESNGGAMVPPDEAGLSWETALVRAESAREERPAANGRRAGRAVVWLKLLFPVIILAGYVGLKAWESLDGPSGGAYFSGLRKEPESLTGVAPDREEKISLSAEEKAFIARLETMVAEKRWKDVASTVASEEGEPFRDNLLVQALAVYARSRSGERNVSLEIEIKNALARLEPMRGRYPEIYHKLELARVDQTLSRSGTPEILSMNTDAIFQWLGKEAKTLHEVDTRINAARTFEGVGDKLAEQAKGYLRDDLLKLREAREYYRTGLRLLVTEKGWKTLEPLSPRTRPDIARIEEKIRAANRKIHGPALPFTENDPETWSGKKGGLVQGE